MKTAAEWLKEIKHASDTEVRHGSSVILVERDIDQIFRDGWLEGWKAALSDATEILRNPELIAKYQKQFGVRNPDKP
jgi:hypothetical protein